MTDVCCTGNTPEERKKVQRINEFLNINISGVNENYGLIKDIDNFLFLKKNPELLSSEDCKKPKVSLGWFDKVIENLRTINCRNTDVGLQLQKLHKETIDK